METIVRSNATMVYHCHYHVVWCPKYRRKALVLVKFVKGGHCSPVAAGVPLTGKTVGVDLGLKSFLVTSDGEMLANPKYYARDEKKLARAQRKLAKKQIRVQGEVVRAYHCQDRPL